MSNTQQTFSAGKARGEGQAKANQMMQPAGDKASRSQAAQGAHESKEQAAGFLQQTGEQVMNKAHEAADAVKHAVGMDTNSSATTKTTTTTTKH